MFSPLACLLIPPTLFLHAFVSWQTRYYSNQSWKGHLPACYSFCIEISTCHETSPSPITTTHHQHHHHYQHHHHPLPFINHSWFIWINSYCTWRFTNLEWDRSLWWDFPNYVLSYHLRQILQMLLDFTQIHHDSSSPQANAKGTHRLEGRR